jgi:DNA/RNA-binding protein KIN17
MTLKLGEKYYKNKGIVINVENRYHAIIKMLEINEKIRIDQAHVETVIPAIGRKVLVVNGAYRGQEATLEDIHQDTFSVDITLLTVRVEILFLLKIRNCSVLGFHDRYSD